MKTGTVIAIGALVIAAGAGIYFLETRHGPNAPAPQVRQPSPAPAGYASGGNGTLNTVSQIAGIADQALSIFGKAQDAFSS